ncbi:MAG: DNA-binding protein [Burkholderiales bacterium]|nr:MAG: DNA-binding protein [Burkholderiales bacterium]
MRSDTGEVKLANGHRSHLTTEELARALNVEPESIHKARSNNGHYCGVTPTKLPNRRLAWPLDAVERIVNGRGVET